MVKTLVIACMLMTPLVVQADWLDDIVTAYDKTNSFEVKEALSIVEKYHEEADKKRSELEQNAKRNDSTEGFWGTVRGGSYQAELALLRNEIEYYKKIARILQEFPENKRQQESFGYSLKKLNRYRKRLEDLRSRYRTSAGVGDKIKLGTAIAAKETQLATYKAYVKNILL